jgi:hypothetical protein
MSKGMVTVNPTNNLKFFWWILPIGDIVFLAVKAYDSTEDATAISMFPRTSSVESKRLFICCICLLLEPFLIIALYLLWSDFLPRKEGIGLAMTY